MTTKTRKPFTSITWAKQGTLNFREQLGWEACVDLGHELARASRFLTYEQARDLVDLTSSGLPIKLTWKTSFGPHRLEKKTAIALVDYIVPPISGNDASTGYIHVHYLGFSTTIYLSQVTGIEACTTEVSYEDVPEQG
jgi:hypothetical protein